MLACSCHRPWFVAHISSEVWRGGAERFQEYVAACAYQSGLAFGGCNANSFPHCFQNHWSIPEMFATDCCDATRVYLMMMRMVCFVSRLYKHVTLFVVFTCIVCLYRGLLYVLASLQYINDFTMYSSSPCGTNTYSAVKAVVLKPVHKCELSFRSLSLAWR